MKRVWKLLAVILGAVLLFSIIASASPALASETEDKPIAFEWGFTPPTGSLDGVWYQKVGDAITELSNGSITFQYSGGGALGNETTCLEGVVSGTIKMCSISPNVVANAIPELNAVCLPFEFDSFEHYFKVMSSDEWNEMINEACEKHGLHYMGPVYTVQRCVFTKTPVTVPSESNGQVIRIMDGQIYANLYAAWGFGTSTIAYGECFTALQNGTVDGIDNTIEGNYDMSIDTVTSNCTKLNYVYHSQHVFVNLDVWNGMSDAQKQAMEQGFDQIYEVIAEETSENPEIAEEKTLARAAEDGRDYTIIDLTDEQLQEWKDAAQPVIEKYQEVIDSSTEGFYEKFQALVDSMR